MQSTICLTLRPSRRDDMTVRFDPKPYTCILVGIRSAESLLAQAGFQNGDRIVSVDGAAVPHGASSIFEWIKKLSRGDTDVACEVVRGGETFHLQAAGSAIRQDSKGWLTPAPR